MAKTKLPSKSGIGGAKVFWIGAILAALLAAGGTFFVLNKVADTTEYFVLNTTIAARTQITPDMLQSVTVSKGGEPRNGFTPAHVASGDVYSLYPINIGDLVTQSNAGPITPINEGIPDNFVVTSFTANAETAVSGRIARGNYIDIIGTAETGNGIMTRYVLRNVYVLEVNSNLGNVQDAVNEGEVTPPGEGATGSDTAPARSGIPAIYTVGLSPEDALVLAAAMNDNLVITLSPVGYNNGGAGESDIIVNKDDIYQESWRTGDSGQGTGIQGEEETPDANDETNDTDTSTPDTNTPDGEESPPAE